MNGCKQLNVQKKIKILNYISFTLVIAITLVVSTFSNYYINNVNNVEENLELQWREEARDKAKYLAQQLELAIAKNSLNYWDDTQLHQWAEEQLLPMKVGGEMSNVIVVNIGYSVRNWDDLNWFSSKDELGLDISPDGSSEISSYFNSMDFIGKSNMAVDEYINSFVEEFVTRHEVDYDGLVNALRQVLFVKNKIIMDTNPGSIINNKFTNSRFIEDYLIVDEENFSTNLKNILSGQESSRLENTSITTSSGKKWLEWCLVPPNKLGWELEPPHKEGVSNVGYKKIAIIVEVSENEIERGYNYVFNSVDTVDNISKIIVISITGVAIVILFTTFYRFLVKEND